MKKLGTLLVCLALGLVGAACSSEGDSSPNVDQGAEQKGLLVSAGEETQKLGIVSWHLASDGMIDGLSQEGKVVAQFKAHHDKAAIESVLPLTGLKMLQEAGGDTFSPQTRTFYEALLRDMKAVQVAPTDESSSSGDNLGKVQQKVWYGPVACCYAQYAAQYSWWVENGAYTRYCHVDVFTSACSGYPSCIDYGYSTGCWYWI